MAREHWTWLRVPRQLNGRTSTGTWQATLRPHASASSRSAASSTHNSCGLVRLTRNMAVPALF
jgi:hypothetical protein